MVILLSIVVISLVCCMVWWRLMYAVLLWYLVVMGIAPPSQAEWKEGFRFVLTHKLKRSGRSR